MTTVQELIEFLQSQPLGLRVLIDNCEWGYDDLNLDDVVVKNVFIGAGDGKSFGGGHAGQHESACPFVVVYNESTKEHETYHKYLFEEWQRVRSFTDPNIYPSHGGEWAWSNGQNRFVRLSPPEPVKPKPIRWPVEKALLLS